MKVLDNVHYLAHPLDDIWTGLVIVGDEQLAIVDSATQAAVRETILPYLADNWLYTPGQPALVINTHCHCDHIGGNAGLKAELGAMVAAHEAEVPFVENRATQFDALFGPFSAYPDLAVDRNAFLALAGEDTGVDHSLTDGQKLALGEFEFEVIHTPGHSAGSLALFEPSLGLLIVGDSVQGDGTTNTLVPLIVDLAAYRSSMRRLAELDVFLLIADHPFKPHSSGFFRGPAATSFVRESETIADEYLDRVAHQLSAQPQPVSLLELSKQIAGELGMAHPNPYILILVSACLEELIQLGEAWRLSGTGWHPASVFSVL